MALSALRKLLNGQPQTPRRQAQPALRLEALEDRWVPSTLEVCPGEPGAYPTINAAVLAAKPGDTIDVCPGTYHESVQVPKTLTFVAESKKGAVIVDPGALGSGFNVQANDVKILGFTVQDAINNPGINLSRAFSGYDIEHNLIRNNTFGLYLNSNGADQTVVRGNAFVDNNVAGAASGNGIYSDQGVSNAVIVDNYFTNTTAANAQQANSAMIFVGNGTTGPTGQDQFNLQILKNVIVDDSDIILVNTHNSTISGNTNIRSNGNGIFFGGNVHDVAVTNNTLRDGTFTGINLKTDPVNFNIAGAAPNTHNLIQGNSISGFGDSGIRLRGGAANNTVTGNTVVHNGYAADSQTGDGITLESAKNNVVSNNVVKQNKRDGIHVDAASAGNRIEDNRLVNNGRFDAYDESAGTGTAGTANIWDDNSGKTQNRPGLLERRDNGDHGDNGDQGDDQDNFQDGKHDHDQSHQQHHTD